MPLLNEQQIRGIVEEEVKKQIDKFNERKKPDEIIELLKGYSKKDHRHRGDMSNQLQLENLISGDNHVVQGTDGTFTWNQMIMTKGLKVVTIYLNTFKSVGGVSATFTKPFQHTPYTTGDQASTATVTASKVTITAASDTTGWVILIGF